MSPLCQTTRRTKQRQLTNQKYHHRQQKIIISRLLYQKSHHTSPRMDHNSETNHHPTLRNQTIQTLTTTRTQNLPYTTLSNRKHTTTYRPHTQLTPYPSYGQRRKPPSSPRSTVPHNPYPTNYTNTNRLQNQYPPKSPYVRSRTHNHRHQSYNTMLHKIKKRNRFHRHEKPTHQPIPSTKQPRHTHNQSTRRPRQPIAPQTTTLPHLSMSHRNYKTTTQ